MTEEHRATSSAIDRLGEISRRVRSIDSIIQTEGRFRIDVGQTGQPLEVVVGEQEPVATMRGALVRVVVGFSFVASEKEEARSEPARVAIDIAARYELLYSFDGEDQLAPDELLVFAEVNGNFNALSFWRQYLNDCLSRAGLPPYMIRPFNAAERIRQIKRRSVENDGV